MLPMLGFGFATYLFIRGELLLGAIVFFISLAVWTTDD